MKLERIKKVRLLTSLKGTDENERPTLWLRGTEFDKEKKPFPPNIVEEIAEFLNGVRFGVLEVLETYPEPQTDTLPEVKEEKPAPKEPPKAPKESKAKPKAKAPVRRRRKK
jgi:hypothetical protein